MNTESFQLAADESKCLVEKRATVRCDRFFGELPQTFVGVMKYLLGTQSQLIYDESGTGFPSGCCHNLFYTDHLQDLDCSRTESAGTARHKNRVIRSWSRSEEHTSELQSHLNLVCRLLLEK